MAADNKSRKGRATGASHDSNGSTSALPVRAWSIGGQVYYARTEREAFKQRAESLGLG